MSAQHTATTPHFSTVKETARALRVSVRTVNTMIARNEIPSVRIGARRLFDLEDVFASIKSRHALATATISICLATMVMGVM